MVRLLVVGVVLEIGGLLGVLVGFDRLAAELFPNHPLTITWARRWLRRRLGRVHTLTATGSMTLESVKVDIQVDQSPPPLGANPTIEERVVWLERHAETSELKISNERTQRTEDATRLGDEIGVVREDLHRATNEIDAQTRKWIGGTNGSSLRFAFYGAVATFAGAICQGIYSLVMA